MPGSLILWQAKLLSFHSFSFWERSSSACQLPSPPLLFLSFPTCLYKLALSEYIKKISNPNRFNSEGLRKWGQKGWIFSLGVAGSRELCSVALRISVPQPGTEPMPPAMEAQSPNHWTTKEFPKQWFLLYVSFDIYVSNTRFFLYGFWLWWHAWQFLLQNYINYHLNFLLRVRVTVLHISWGENKTCNSWKFSGL